MHLKIIQMQLTAFASIKANPKKHSNNYEMFENGTMFDSIRFDSVLTLHSFLFVFQYS